MSETPNETVTKSANSAPPVRNIIRSRMRAAPNVAISSGMARNRRLSGHYIAPAEKKTLPVNSNEINVQADPSKSPAALPRSRSPSISQSRSPARENVDLNENSRETILNTQLNSIQTASAISLKPKSPASNQHHDHLLGNKLRMPLISKINSPKITEDSIYTANSPSIHQSNQALSFRQYVNYRSNILKEQSTVSLVPLSPSVSYNQPPTPNLMPRTPGGTEYHPKFSNEQIMNIIKHKSLQKLKKIEAESLKEKRKNYQSNLNEQDKNGLDNNNSNDTFNMPIDRSKTRMRDLLYYNSKTKKSDNSNELIVESPIMDEGSNQSCNISLTTSDASSNGNETLSTENQQVKEKETSVQNNQILNSAPQLKFADDGTIIINEESLLIERNIQEPVYNSTVVESEQIDNLTYVSYRKFNHTKKWTERETAKFYKALSMIGTDFTMIQRLFSHRSRDEIKRKFKREEKINQALIDKIMSKTSEIDLSVFVSTSSDDEQRKKSKTSKVLKKRVTKEKNNIIEPKGKLKRIQKRAFIESESEDDTSSKKKSFDYDTYEISMNPVLYSKEPANQNKEIPTISINNAPQEDESNDEDEELVLDLDNNTITSHNSILNVSYKPTQSSSKFENAEKSLNSIIDFNQENNNIILDLDNNKIIENSSILDMNHNINQTGNELASNKSKSKIEIIPIEKS